MNIVEVMRLYLAPKGYRVTPAYRAVDALSIIGQRPVNLAILDIMLPDMDGWTLCQKIREVGDIPILMVTAKGDSTDKVRGFQLGADDYLAKPFDPNELLARVEALLRRTYASTPRMAPLARLGFGEVSIDTVGHIVAVRGCVIDLSRREYQLLLILAQHPNRILTRSQLLDLVWGIDYTGNDRVVDVTIKRLRQKMGTERHASWGIATIRGMGYRLWVGTS